MKKSLPQLLLLLCAFVLPPIYAQAQESDDDESRATTLFEEGRQLYTQGRYEEAIARLEAAFRLRPAPPILLNIGRTYEKLNKPKLALATYRRFLHKARCVDPSRALVAQLVQSLEKKLGIAPQKGAGLETPTAATSATGLRSGSQQRTLQLIHTPVDSVKVRQAVLIQAELPPDLLADSVLLYWRKGGQRGFQAVTMHQQGEGYLGEIPARQVTSSSLQYYLVAKRGKGSGKVVARAGSRTTPNIVVIEGGRAPHLGPRPTAIRSPYRRWLWIAAGAATGALATGLTFSFLALDRANALETRASQSCTSGSCANPKIRFGDGSTSDFESQGKTFSLIGALFIGLSVVSGGLGGYLWVRERQYIDAQKALQDEAALAPQRLHAAPWFGPNAAGLSGAWLF